jgi:hypothetical protein
LFVLSQRGPGGRVLHFWPAIAPPLKSSLAPAGALEESLMLTITLPDGSKREYPAP